MDLPPIEVPYLMTRFIAPKMAWRSYISAVILPSEPDAMDESVESGMGVVKGCKCSADAFGRLTGFELDEMKAVEFVVARGEPGNAMAALGNQLSSN